jgi:SAM-dependent methyltransferase
MIIKHFKKTDRVKQKEGYSKKVAVEKIRKIAYSVHPGNTIIHRCGICRSSVSVDFVTIYDYLWKRCKTCDSIFVANPPTVEDLEKMYKSEEFASMNKHIFNEDNMWFRVNEIVKPKHDFVKKYITTNNYTWLDVGCGPGELLYIVQQDGWAARGIDTDPVSAEFGIKHFDVNIYNKYFSLEDFGETNTKYGVISMMNVLEHCLEPRELIEVASSLQDVGDNLMLELPHFPSLSAHLCAGFRGAVSRVMTPPLHLYVFSLAGTSMMLNNYGYMPTACWMYGQDVGELLDTLDYVSNGVVSFSEVMHQIYQDLQKVVDKRHLGDHFLIFAEKRK